MVNFFTAPRAGPDFEVPEAAEFRGLRSLPDGRGQLGHGGDQEQGQQQLHESQVLRQKVQQIKKQQLESEFVGGGGGFGVGRGGHGPPAELLLHRDFA